MIYEISSGMCLEEGGKELTLTASLHPTITKSRKRIEARKTVLLRLVLARRINTDLDGDPLGSVMASKASYLAIARVWIFANCSDNEKQSWCVLLAGGNNRGDFDERGSVHEVRCNWACSCARLGTRVGDIEGTKPDENLQGQPLSSPAYRFYSRFTS